MLTLDSIFDALGGPAEIGRIIGKTTEHAASFRRRGKVPVAYWPALLSALTAKGIEASEADFVLIYNASKGDSSSTPDAEAPKPDRAA